MLSVARLLQAGSQAAQAASETPQLSARFGGKGGVRFPRVAAHCH